MSVSANASSVVVIASLVVPPGLPAIATTWFAHGATCQAATAAPASCSSRRRETVSDSDTVHSTRRSLTHSTRGTRRIATTELERHASAGRAAALAVATDLVRHRWADGADES